MLQEIVGAYLVKFPEERPGLAAFLKQIETGEALNDRKNFNGHITGSALVLSPDRRKILVVYHKLFSKWLQPGGHWEADEIGPWTAAKREVEEETGVTIDFQLLTTKGDERVPLDIGTHLIKNRPHKKEPAHDHHDMRYVFVAKHERLVAKKKEVNIADMAWMFGDDPRLNNIKLTIAKLRRFGLLA